ncbi:TetR/AcrR family transcriptional regulator [Jonesia quinghaiensis]|uniref:TetR/AcrR family transcriptional regulator n=1 Tax=Jonesia quinghaiensis TaxID=262806 RepID=UPI000685ED5E|nr:TetR/AcrR family transcriptional regulator [Jonesia quinghaiensis]
MSEDLSRRERNRREAYETIHRVAYNRIVTQGQCGATVETLADAAGVSPRTFFNYYRSKEDAVLGVRPPEVTPHQLDSLAVDTAAELLERVVHLLIDVMRASVIDHDTLLERREAVADMSELRTRLTRHFYLCELAVLEALSRSLDVLSENQTTELRAAGPQPERALTALAGAVVRYSFAVDSNVLTRHSHDAVAQSINTFKKIVKVAL